LRAKSLTNAAEGAIAFCHSIEGAPRHSKRRLPDSSDDTLVASPCCASRDIVRKPSENVVTSYAESIKAISPANSLLYVSLQLAGNWYVTFAMTYCNI
jgi:hypothetical protein